MTMLDADRMLAWKNYPETRRFAIVSHAIIKRKNHLEWLAKNIQFFRMVVEKGRVCGAVRVQGREVSIWIDRKFWGRGLATRVVKKVSKKGSVAKIVAGNIDSLRCFIKAGYLPVSFRDGYYVFRK